MGVPASTNLVIAPHVYEDENVAIIGVHGTDQLVNSQLSCLFYVKAI